MQITRGYLSIALGLLSALQAFGQTGSSLILSSTRSFSVQVKQGQTATATVRKELPTDPLLLDVISDADGLTITITQPSGAVVTASSAQSAGYGWTTFNNQSDGGVLSAFVVGFHNLIEIPQSNDAGSYTLNLSGASLSEDTLVRITVLPQTNYKFGLTTTKQEYKLSENIVLAAAFLKGTAPVTAADVSATYVFEGPTTTVAANGFTETTEPGNQSSRVKRFRMRALNSGASQSDIKAEVDMRALPTGVEVNRSYVPFPTCKAVPAAMPSKTLR